LTAPTWRDFVALEGRPVSVTVRGTVRVDDGQTDTIERMTYAPPDHWRIEADDGTLRYLANDTGHVQYPRGGGPVACFQPRDAGHWQSGGTASPPLIRPRGLDPLDDDFTRPIGPVRELTYLGRPAWQVVLAPPARKPYPMVQVVDVATGLTLAMQSLDGHLLLGFTAIETGITLPDDTFAAAG